MIVLISKTYYFSSKIIQVAGWPQRVFIIQFSAIILALITLIDINFFTLWLEWSSIFGQKWAINWVFASFWPKTQAN